MTAVIAGEDVLRFAIRALGPAADNFYLDTEAYLRAAHRSVAGISAPELRALALKFQAPSEYMTLFDTVTASIERWRSEPVEGPDPGSAWYMLWYPPEWPARPSLAS